MLPEGETFTVCWLKVGEDYPLLDYLEDLAATDSDCFASVIDKMRRLEDSRYHRAPAVKWLSGKHVKGLLELRVMSGAKRMYARIPFIRTAGKVILLFGETKKGGTSPPGFIDKAIKLRDKFNTNEAEDEQIDFTVFDD